MKWYNFVFATVVLGLYILAIYDGYMMYTTGKSIGMSIWEAFK